MFLSIGPCSRHLLLARQTKTADHCEQALAQIHKRLCDDLILCCRSLDSPVAFGFDVSAHIARLHSPAAGDRRVSSGVERHESKERTLKRVRDPWAPDLSNLPVRPRAPKKIPYCNLATVLELLRSPSNCRAIHSIYISNHAEHYGTPTDGCK